MWKRKATVNTVEMFSFASNNATTLASLFSEHLISLEDLKIKFSEETLEEFWLTSMKSIQKISEKAFCCNFHTFASSTPTNVETKKREKLLGLDEDMRVAPSSLYQSNDTK